MPCTGPGMGVNTRTFATPVECHAVLTSPHGMLTQRLDRSEKGTIRTIAPWGTSTSRPPLRIRPGRESPSTTPLRVPALGRPLAMKAISR